jgi:hypothetical protein
MIRAMEAMDNRQPQVRESAPVLMQLSLGIPRAVQGPTPTLADLTGKARQFAPTKSSNRVSRVVRVSSDMSQLDP